MSSIGGAGLTKITEIADNTDELEESVDNIEISVKSVFEGYGLYA